MNPESYQPQLVRRPELHDLLSSREWEVLDLQVQGLGYKQIADKLGLSESTVKNHLTRVHEKLQTHNIATTINKAYIRPAN